MLAPAAQRNDVLIEQPILVYGDVALHAHDRLSYEAAGLLLEDDDRWAFGHGDCGDAGNQLFCAVPFVPCSLSSMQKVQLGQSDLRVTPICLGTMTFGEQVDETTAHAILHRSLERGVDFIDTAEMYAVPTRKETFGATETIIGNWFAKNPGTRAKTVLATKVAGPSRGMPWVREGSG